MFCFIVIVGFVSGLCFIVIVGYVSRVMFYCNCRISFPGYVLL